MRLAALLLFVAAVAIASATTTRAPAPAPQGSPVSSCSSVSCHGGGEVGRPGSEHSTWAAGDPHVKAYSVLFNEESRRIMANLGRKGAAHEDRSCLVCHTAGTDVCLNGEAATDGVGCDACHGPSKLWITRHYEHTWKTMSDTEKASLGFRNTKDLGTRISQCAKCHIGDAERNVDHDLIAAGHPRLAFEYTRFYYQPGYKKHWIEKLPPREFEIRAWFIGQVASLKTAAERTAAWGPSATHPEFSEQSCFSCHKPLDGVPKPGAKPPAWQPWHLACIDLLAATTSSLFPGAAKPDVLPVWKLDATMAKPNPPADEIVRNAKAVVAAMDAWLAELQRVERENPDRAVSRNELRALAAMIAAIAEQSAPDWDLFAAQYLGLAALFHADNAGLAEIKAPLENLKALLNYPKGSTGPKKLDADKIRKEFRAVAGALAPGTAP